MSHNQIRIIDFTLFGEFTHNDVIEALDGWAKKYCFQLEITDTKKLHFQGKFSLIKKRRFPMIKKKFKELPKGTPLHCMRLSPSHVTVMDYVTKQDTRVEGPWADTDPEPPYIPRQIREIKSLRPFQQNIIDNVDIWDTRHINLVYCPKGNKGKTILVGYLRAHGLARALPPVNDSKDFLRMVYCLPTSRCYIVDMPRAMKKDKLAQFFSAIETVKDGYAYDDRYTFKEKNFDCPNIWIFTNTLPNTHYLSSDRWKYWGINRKYELCPIHQNEPDEPEG